ncbi:MAG: prepilin-type N-terminal cleavage/methylation domain-containing protein [Acidobacteriota bacterium]
MSARSLKAQGFTLVEILIVVVILGILAAIVIPQFTSASEAAKASSIQTQLQTIRSQIELYQIQHNGDFPGLTAATDGTAWDALTETTDLDNTIQTDGTGEFGPYLQKAPVNGFTGESDVVLTSTTNGAVGAASGDIGWLYNTATGTIKASIETAKAIEVGLLETGETEAAAALAEQAATQAPIERDAVLGSGVALIASLVLDRAGFGERAAVLARNAERAAPGFAPAVLRHHPAARGARCVKNPSAGNQPEEGGGAWLGDAPGGAPRL